MESGYIFYSKFRENFLRDYFSPVCLFFRVLIRFELLTSVHKRYVDITASEVHSCISVIGSEEVDLEDRPPSPTRHSVFQQC